MFLTFHEHVDRACALQVLPELLLCGFAHNDDLLSRLLRKLFQRDPDTREVLYSEQGLRYQSVLLGCCKAGPSQHGATPGFGAQCVQLFMTLVSPGCIRPVAHHEPLRVQAVRGKA